MKLTCLKWQLEERCRERGYALEEVLGCVVSVDGDDWTIDTDSPHYPLVPKRGFIYPGTPNIQSLSREAPGFLAKVKNFAAAAAGHVAAGMPMASDEEIIRRHDICLTCEHLQNGACTHCGCPISRVAGYVSKLSWANEECPIGKWGKTTVKNQP